MLTSERLLSKGKKGHAIPKKATSLAGLSSGTDAKNLNVGKKVNFPGQKFPFHEGFIKKVHASSEIDYDLHQPRFVIIEVAFAETKRNSLDEALNAIHKKKKFFKWHQVDNRTGKHQEHDHERVQYPEHGTNLDPFTEDTNPVGREGVVEVVEGQLHEDQQAEHTEVDVEASLREHALENVPCVLG